MTNVVQFNILACFSISYPYFLEYLIMITWLDNCFLLFTTLTNTWRKSNICITRPYYQKCLKIRLATLNLTISTESYLRVIWAMFDTVFTTFSAVFLLFDALPAQEFIIYTGLLGRSQTSALMLCTKCQWFECFCTL